MQTVHHNSWYGTSDILTYNNESSLIARKIATSMKPTRVIARMEKMITTVNTGTLAIQQRLAPSVQQTQQSKAG